LSRKAVKDQNEKKKKNLDVVSTILSRVSVFHYL
jgi:hypothetical protein